jgi:hypothetical protein
MFQSLPRRGRVGLAGALAVGVAVAISSFSTVRADRPSTGTKGKTYNCTTGAACVEGNSAGANTYGAYGISQASDGVHGLTSSTTGNSGVAGISNGTTGSGHGVYGRASNGPGVEGTSSATCTGSGLQTQACAGVYGTSTSSTAYASVGVLGNVGNSVGVLGNSNSGPGVYGNSNTNAGVTGASNTYFGVSGVSSTGTGVVGASESSDLYAISAQADSTSTDPFQAWNLPNNVQCIIDAKTNLSCDGSLTGGKDLKVRHTNSSGRQVLAYAAQSASESIDDVGSAHIVGGVARVGLDDDFASTIDRSTPYHVFLTPMGDTRGLYVSRKTASGFEVREAQGGRSSVDFVYRIGARPLDAKSDRLPSAPAMRKPPIYSVLRPR